ncbi:MAG: RNA polymerase sigma factor [Desulfobacteraceae bacterium]|nr:RNA polymerase sigma factor [Desulfobacteraceae bacterium]
MSSAERHNNLGREANAEIQTKVKLATEIFAEHGDEILAIIRFNVNDKSRADDIFQDFFLSIVYQPLPEGIQNVKGYLYRAAINDVIDAARRTKSYQARIHRYAEYRKYSIIHEDPENIVLQAEERQKMIQLIERQLPPREAEAVLQRYGHDCDIGNAAKRMRVTKRTFSRYLCIGLKKIRQILRESKGEWE